MKSVINKTRTPIKIPLPGGKTLHLGLVGSGQIPDEALERPAFKKLVEAGKIEVLDEAGRPEAGGKMSTRVQKASHGHPASKKISNRGDR
ncbi:MAG: hypothetical protein O7F16_12845 [Acidobacteria bacterium]|nr:hypothetical protein [Acidobacteriota bacterium]